MVCAYPKMQQIDADQAHNAVGAGKMMAACTDGCQPSGASSRTALQVTFGVLYTGSGTTKKLPSLAEPSSS